MQPEIVPQGHFRAGVDCVWSTLENGVHIFKFMAPTRRGADEWFAHLDVLFAEAPASETIRYIMDYRIATAPLAYGAQRARKWLDEHPDIPFTRAAFLYRERALITLLDGLIKLLRAKKVVTRFFDDYTKAMEWVLAD